MTDNISLDTVDDGAEALLKSWNTDAADAPIRSDEEENRTDESEVEADDVHESDPSDVETDEEDVSDDQDDATEEQSEETTATVADDAHVVKVSVDGVEQEFKVSDLKRLAGQEVSLRRKGEEIASQRKQIETDTAKTVAATEALIQRAMERYKPYENIDWAEAAATMETEDYRALKQVATAAYADLQFLHSELDGHMKARNEANNAKYVEIAKETIKELSDPNTGIAGFSKEYHRELSVYAASLGIPDSFEVLAYPAPWRVLDKALRWDKQQSAKASTSKVVKTATKVIKSRTNVETTRKASSSSNSTRAMEQLKASGSVEDAANAFLSRWRTED